MTTLEEHKEKPVADQVIGHEQIKIGGIYRRHLFREEGPKETDWFIVVDKYQDEGSYRCVVYNLETGRKRDRFLSDMGVEPYSENNYHDNACTEKHPLSIPEELVERKSKVDKIRDILS